MGIDFLCACNSGEVVLSDEHDSFAWLTEPEFGSRHPEQQQQFAAAFRTRPRS